METPDFPAILKRERKRAGLGQDEMAFALRMSQSNYSRLERGKRRYTVIHLFRAKRRLRVPWAVLAGDRKVGDAACHAKG